MKINNSTDKDIESIFQLYKVATTYQRAHFPDNIWPEFERALVESEIRENRQWKIVIDGAIACVWATTFNDPIIWEEKDLDPSVYIHRIATHPDFRGRQFVTQIVEWAKDYARSNSRSFIRLDTCGHNHKLIEHYQKCGFDFLGIWKLKDSSGLPCHYENADVCFFEIDLEKDQGHGN